MSDTALIIIFSIVLVHVGVNIKLLASMCNGDGFALSPLAMKDSFDLTWFGTIVLFTLSLILFTGVYLICFIYFLFKGKFPEEFE